MPASECPKLSCLRPVLGQGGVHFQALPWAEKTMDRNADKELCVVVASKHSIQIGREYHLAIGSRIELKNT
jgi:hypothetical protein